MMLEMRELKGADTFKMIAIMNKTGVPKALKELLNGGLGEEVRKILKIEDSVEETEESKNTIFESAGLLMAVSVAEIVIGEIEKAEKEINSFLANLTGVKIKEIENLPLAEYMALIIKFFQKPELVGFIDAIKPLLGLEE